MSNKEKKRILVSRDFPHIAVKMLRQEGFSVTAWAEDRPMTPTELISSARNHHALLCTVTDKIDKAFLHECRHLDIISQYAVGFDNIDISEATKLGIPVGYTPNAMNEAAADIAFGLMIATARKMFYLHKTILRGEWRYFRPKAHLGMELNNKTLGIFGLGRIGFEMARRCKGAYHMRVLYHNRRPNPVAEEKLGAERVGFDALLAQSDVISVHCSLTEETKEIFNKSAFRKMKSNAIFVNTSRGMVHHEGDLIDALVSGQIWGAGLDVTNPEPMRSDNPLLSMENVTVLPHVGSGTIEARNEMARLAALNIIEYYMHNRVPNLANPEIIKTKIT